MAALTPLLWRVVPAGNNGKPEQHPPNQCYLPISRETFFLVDSMGYNKVSPLTESLFSITQINITPSALGIVTRMGRNPFMGFGMVGIWAEHPTECLSI